MDNPDYEWGIDTNKFSSPMPVIGLYAATATAACLAFMVVDIIAGIRRKKRWIPCKLFSLNSLTLTLIAIATKIPSDLTTPLLSRMEQSSKALGFMFLRTCIDFFLPSLGSTTPSQNLSNMISLTILVITICVNWGIQIFTGASLIFEPLAIFFYLSLLLPPLLDLWISGLEINNEKIIIADLNRENLINSSGSMIRRLRCCYVQSYTTNPQLLLCVNQYGFFLRLYSLLVTGSLQFYAIPVKAVGHSEVTSDYKRSIYVINATQYITILVSTIVTLSRCFVFPGQIVLYTSVNFLLATAESLQVMNMINHKTAYQHLICAATRFLMLLLSIRLRTTLLTLRVKAAFMKYLCIGGCRGSVPESIDEQQKKVKKWIEKQGEEDIDRLIDLYSKESPNRLIQLLSETPPSDELLHEYQLPCLSAVLLVRMASETFPAHPLNRSLIHAFDEAFHVIFFVDKNMHAASFENQKKLEFAEKMWKHWDFKSPLKRYDIGKVTNFVQSTTGLRTTQRDSYFNSIQKEISLIENTIHCLRFSSNMDPYIGIKQLLVDMLHKLLSKFPIAVFKYVTEAPITESKDRIKLRIKFLCKLELLEDNIQWEFPSETNITSLITPHPPSPSDCNIVV